MIVIKNPLDMHLHLRDNDMLSLVAPLSSKTFSGALIMPNLVPPITSKEMVLSYKNRILNSINDDFIPYMTLFFQNYSKEFLEDIKDEILAIKLYPAGITTNSENGVKDIDNIYPTLEYMSELNIPLCIHGETNDFVLDREKNFLPIYEKLAKDFPKLKIIMEHITTKDSVELLEKYDNLFATITLHHLLITLDDVAGGLLQPHLFCKPIAKTPKDKIALQKAALTNKKVMFGSDSAPHPKHKKETLGCAAGIFTAPIALAVLAEFFEDNNSLDTLNDFVSNNAQKIYNITPIEKEIKLIKKDFIVPEFYANSTNKVVPFLHNTKIRYSLC